MDNLALLQEMIRKASIAKTKVIPSMIIDVIIFSLLKSIFSTEIPGLDTLSTFLQMSINELELLKLSIQLRPEKISGYLKGIIGL